MEKNRISKIIALIITFVLITCISTSVFADGQLDLDSITGGDTSGDETTEEEYEDLTGEIETEEEEKTPVEEEDESKKEEEEEKSESKYEESDIPHAGPEDTILMVVLFIALAGVSGFTFIKLSEYSNI